MQNVKKCEKKKQIEKETFYLEFQRETSAVEILFNFFVKYKMKLYVEIVNNIELLPL